MKVSIEDPVIRVNFVAITLCFAVMLHTLFSYSADLDFNKQNYEGVVLGLDDKKITGRIQYRCSLKSNSFFDEYYLYNFYQIDSSESEKKFAQLHLDFKTKNLTHSYEIHFLKIKKNLLSCVVNFYELNGINLILSETEGAEHKIEVTTNGKSHHSRISLNDYHSGEALPFRRLCSLLAHEVGHMLGFADTYSDPGRCPDRSLGQVGDLMFSGSLLPIERLKISPTTLSKFRLHTKF